jgi:hypothetical protein
MAAMEEPKKAPAAYFLFTNATRAEAQKATGSTKFGDVAKWQADRWKTMPAKEKATYEKQAADAKAQYEKDLAAFKEAGGVVGQRRQDKKAAKQAKTDKAAKKEANVGKPKAPAGGGYGVYVRKHREEIVKSLPPGHKCTEVSKAAGERWKALSEEAKKPYEAEYQQQKEQYQTELKAWKEAKGADAKDDDEEEEEEEKSSPQKADAKKATPKKRAAADAKEKPESPPAKKAKGAGKEKKKEAEGPKIPVEIIEQAKKAKLDGALTNLANRQDIVDKNISADKLLDALQKSGGLVNKARATLLGA